MSSLEQLKGMSVIVADTGDIEAIKKHKPQDATTNPSLILKAADLPQYANLLPESLTWAKSQSDSSEETLNLAVDYLSVKIGCQILDIIPGRVSTEIDARLSFDTEQTIRRAERIINLYEENGYNRDRILIKIASTWEGIRAAEILEKENIQCNLTLLFGMHQAKACADAGVTLISPFVGRILDWYTKNTGASYSPADEPGVASVTSIFNYYKQHDYKTIVMAASFRNVGEIIALAGCDYLTISPDFLQDLSDSNQQIERQLDATNLTPLPKQILDEKEFRWQLNADAMANEKLAQGICSFDSDLNKLKAKLGNMS